MGGHLSPHVLERDVFVVGHFLWIRDRRDVTSAKKDMVKLVLNQAAIQFRSVDEIKPFGQLTLHAHLFLEPSDPRFNDGFSISGMAAARVCPKSTAVVLVVGTLLEQQFSLAVENEHTERPVQNAFFMGRHLFHGALGLVQRIHQDDVFF